MPKLKKKDISLREMVEISKVYYSKHDDKRVRMRMDVRNARLTEVKNFEYDPLTKEWKQTKGKKRHIKFIFMVESVPISYNRNDTIPKHYYPVIFVFFDLEAGINSAFKWRTGSQRRVKFAHITEGMTKEQKHQQRLNTTNTNIRNMRQLDFFFKLENILKSYGLLYGVDTTNGKPPIKANPDLIPYLDKTALFCVDKILRKLLTKKGIDELMKKLGFTEKEVIDTQPATVFVPDYSIGGED